MSEAVKQRTMTEGRALLTEREKEALAGDGSDSYRYKTRTYFRSRLEKLEGDVDMLAEHDPELLDELRDVVCAGDESDAHMPRERSASQADRDTTADEQRRDAPESGVNESPLGDVLADLPSTVDPDPAREAILAARVYLEEHGRATRTDFIRDVMSDFPLGYDVDDALAKIEAGEEFRGSWWRNVVKPGLEALDDVEKPPRGASDWKYRGGSGE